MSGEEREKEEECEHNLMDCFQGPGNRSSEDNASPEVTENTNYTWSLSGISLTYDTSDVSVFPGGSDRKSGQSSYTTTLT